MNTFIPPFCPNPGCTHHLIREPDSYSAFIRYGYHHTRTFGSVPRFQCTSCRKTFSSQTFQLSYDLKRPPNFERIKSSLSSCSGIRAIGRSLGGASCASVSTRIARMARNTLASSSRLASSRSPTEHLASDGFESFCVSQFFPNNITLLVGKDSAFVYTLDHATLRRKGRMTEAQKKKRARLDKTDRPDPKALTTSFSSILTDLVPVLLDEGGKRTMELWTDKKKEYARALGRHVPGAFLVAEERLAHRTVSSRAARTKDNPLWSVNYMDREIRKDLKEHVRETVCHGRNVNNQMDRMSVYVYVHNGEKHYRIGGKGEDERTHAEVAGYDREEVAKERKGIWGLRSLWSREWLGESARRTWFRERWTPGKRGKEYLPKRVAS